MENFIQQSYTQLEEIKLPIYDFETAYYGGSQYWFPKKNHQINGCGPIVTANITVYLSQAFPEKFKDLYPFESEVNKKDFIEHMIEIRKYVKPGLFGLTSVHQFVDNTLDYVNKKGLSLVPHILDDDSATMMEAVEYIFKALLLKLPVAILVLTHPVKELEDYAWHWMTITHLRYDSKEQVYYITVSTYGERHEINLDLLWNHRGPKDHIKLAYFVW